MLKKLFIIFLGLLLFVSGALLFSWGYLAAPVNPKNEETQIFVIPKGWGAQQIANSLQEQGLIRNPLVFRLLVIKEGIGDQLQAGDFRLSPSMNLFEIAQTLTHGTIDVWVTIPEGLRREEIGQLIKKEFGKQEADFRVQDFVLQTKNLEGQLFPDTYLLAKDAEIETIVETLNNNFEAKYEELSPKTTLTKKQTVVLASLVEREAKYEKDRQLVAGIILKRLKKGWSLDIDATAQYVKANFECSLDEAECDWWPKVAASDLRVDSPYNTYENLGLPPTAICNPSLSSLKAAADPKDSAYWFYLSDSSAKMHYAKTLEEHEANIEKYLR